jgi:NAD-dependent DNA ligase
VARRKLIFFPWEVLSEHLDQDPSQDSATGRLLQLVHYRFRATDDAVIQEPHLLGPVLAQMSKGLLEIDPEIGRDGLVFKVDSVKERKKLGGSSKFANFQIAYKLQNQKIETTVLDVKWQVGRTGKLTPVAIVDPVVLGGARIERVTLNNLSWLRDLGVKIGSRVALMRSGDVIPKITEVLDV